MAEPKIDKTEKKPTEAEASATEEEDEQPPQTDAQELLYANFVRGNQILTVEDLAVYKGQNGGVIVVLTDPIGRSLVNVSFYIKPEILNKLNEAVKKG